MAYQNYGSAPMYGHPQMQQQQPSYPYAQAQTQQPHSQPYAQASPYTHSSAPTYQSAYHQDPFREWYRQQLSTLTFNSRPIIQNLSIQAMERRDRNDWNGMTAVGEELERAIGSALPTCKLPLLYLLDSISKNVGQPYTTHVFPRFIAQTFVNAYRAVDGATRTKMAEMLRTWKHGGVGGVELFGPDVRHQIEAEIFATRVDPARERVVISLADALRSKRAALARNPEDAEARVHVGVLEQIEKLLNMGNVQPNEIHEIQLQLDKIRAEDRGTPQPPFVPDVQPRPPGRPLGEVYPNVPLVNVASNNSPYMAGGNTPTNGFQAGHVRTGSIPIAPQTVPPPKMDFGNLLRDLTFAGVIGSSASTPVQTTPVLQRAAVVREGSVGSVASSAFKNNGSEQGDVPDEADGLKEYEEMVLSMNVGLSLNDLNKVYDFQPTAHLPNRCSQCAARFPAGPAGKDRLQAHLDWHFRRNRKEKENEGRGANRRWLPRAEFWIKDVTSNVISADGASSSGPSTSNKPGLGMAPKVDAAFVARQRAELQNSWIPVPSDPARAALPCPICKEKFVSEYNEDEEEWIWKNAIEADGQISHATCRSDAVATAVANRVIANADGKNLGLRANSPARSRGNTPQPGSSLAVKNSPRSIRGGTPAGNPSPAIPTKLATDETDVKPSAAILQAADRLTTAVSQLREGSTDSTTSAGVKRKADEDVDSHKEAKREKA